MKKLFLLNFITAFFFVIGLYPFDFVIGSKSNLFAFEICLNIFKSNNFFGLIIFVNLLIGKVSF